MMTTDSQWRAVAARWRRIGFRGLTARAIVAAGLAGAGLALAAAGDLDPGFATGGLFLSPPSTTTTREGNAVALQPDGKIVIAGTRVISGEHDIAVWRLNQDGTPDPDFGSGGEAVLTLPFDQEAKAVAIQKDTKIVAAGFMDGAGSPAAVIARFDADGVPDPSFDDDGFLVQDFGAGHARVLAVAIQRDGKILTAGSNDAAGDDDFAVARFHPDGSPDDSFDGDGLVTTGFGTGREDVVVALAIQKDGKIVAAGATEGGSGEDFAIARYNRDGSLDVSFGGDGLVTTDFGGEENIRGVAIQKDGKIVTAGAAFLGGSDDFALARYRKNGTLDLSFDGDGKVTTDFGTDGDDEAAGVAVQKDGKIVTVGRARTGGFDDFALARFRKNGRPDPGFGMGGRLLQMVFTDSDQATAVALQKDGKILAAGFGFDGSVNRAVVARFLGR
jgi:uncharacterized delta-60 repeat protein